MSNVIKRSATTTATTPAAPTPSRRRANSASNATQVEKRVIYLLGLVAMVMFGYPISQVAPFGAYVYLFLYASMVVMGGSMAGASRIKQVGDGRRRVGLCDG